MYNELCVELLLSGDENNEAGNTYLCYGRGKERKERKYIWELAQKERSLVFAKHA
jgi:hypothetical protein